jgi:hypothetical protein
MDDYDICLDSIERDTIEFIVAKSEVEVLFRQWRLLVDSCFTTKTHLHTLSSGSLQ